MASATKRKRDIALSPLIEKAVKQARSARPAREDRSRVVAPGTMIEAPLYMRMAPTPSKSASPVKNAEGDESEDELLIEQASRRKVTRPSPKRPAASSQPVASTSEIPYTPPQRKRKLESEEHGGRSAPGPQAQLSASIVSSKGKGKALPRIKQEVDDSAPDLHGTEPAPRAVRPQASPTSPRQSRTTVTVEIPVRRQPQLSKQVPSTSRKKGPQIQAVSTPTSMKRPKIEEPDEDVLFVRKADAAPKLAAREGVGEPPPPPVPQQQVGAVVRFLTHQCDPPIPQDRLQVMVDLFKKLGISTEYELKAIAKPGNVQDFWMGVARKEGLSTLWEAVIRDGLGKLVC